MPFKVLDAPQLQDDFYLNLVDWSSSNILAVGLGKAVYIWSACTSRVTKLMKFLWMILSLCRMELKRNSSSSRNQFWGDSDLGY